MFMDKECQTDATQAGYTNAATFVAFVPMSNASMLERLGTGPWARPDHVTFLAADLTVLAPLNVTPAIDYVDDAVWGGTTRIDRPAQLDENCSDWGDTVAAGLLGRTSRAGIVEMVDEYDYHETCLQGHHVYCIDP
jgi:hypothetical protein